MLSTLTEHLASVVTKRWQWVLLAWVLLTGLLLAVAPKWKQVAYDGDFDYLPADSNTLAAARVLDEAFPGRRSRSQIVFVLGRDQEALTPIDLMVGDDLLRRLYHRLAEVSWQRAITLGYQGGPISQAPEECREWIRRTREALTYSIDVDQRFYERFSEFVPDIAPTLTEPRMAIAYYDRSKLLALLSEENNPKDQVDEGKVNSAASDTAEDAQTAIQDYHDALILVPEIDKLVVPIEQRDLSAWDALLDVLSWDDPVVGSRLSKPSARLAVMQLSSELAATENIALVESVRSLLRDVRQYSVQISMDKLNPETSVQLEFTGSAAIGGETLIAARDAIRYTESITVIMILLILILVYRAPLLVAVPMLSIGIAVAVSTSLVALLTDWSIREVVPGLDVRVFTTSRIFIVVILFGAGTDYCLFLISRLREEAARAPWPIACQRALAGVTSALLGSALTTVFGLAMLWFAEFGKYHYTGPIIAICLMIGLLVCLTLAPALLCAFGEKVFWPGIVQVKPERIQGLFSAVSGDDVSDNPKTRTGLWDWIAITLTRRPLLAFLLGIVVLSVPAVYGWLQEERVTYDLSSQLDNDAASRRGFRLLVKHFHAGEINPVTVLMMRAEDEPRESFRKKIKSLSDLLYQQPGVEAVRSAIDPLGDFPPDHKMGLLSSDAWRRRALQKHRVAQNYFFSEHPDFGDRLARLDVVVTGDPFSVETADRIIQMRESIQGMSDDEQSDWHGSTVCWREPPRRLSTFVALRSPITNASRLLLCWPCSWSWSP